MLNTDINYWQINNGVSIIYPFSELYKSDKSKDKHKSSRIMWALEMYCRTDKENPMRNMSKSEREAELLYSFISDDDLTTVKDLEKSFVDFKLSYVNKRFKFYQTILEQREEYMSTLSYDTNADLLDDMLVRTPKIWSEFMKIKKELDAEEEAGHVQGGREESAAEKGLL